MMSSSKGGPLARANVRLHQKRLLLQKRTLNFYCFWNRRFWTHQHPERVGCNLPYTLENFYSSSISKTFKKFFWVTRV
ncbi:ORF293 [White spot syndrome virus]|nr:ORF291 [White spot syndrome virus]ATU83873.1 ORF293 [White spot syndrome virus]